MEQLAKLHAAIDACASQLEHLNDSYPQLATTATLQSVEQWRGRNEPSTLIEEPTEAATRAAETPSEPIDMREVAVKLVAEHSVEDALELLFEQHRIELTLPELVHLIGRKVYVTTLKRDLQELLKNAISYEQIANLWNDLERPAPGNGAWSSRSVSLLDT